MPIEVKRWKAADGTEFETKEQAVQHEAETKHVVLIDRWLDGFNEPGTEEGGKSDRACARMRNDVGNFLSWASSEGLIILATLDNPPKEG